MGSEGVFSGFAVGEIELGSSACGSFFFNANFCYRDFLEEKLWSGRVVSKGMSTSQMRKFAAFGMTMGSRRRVRDDDLERRRLSMALDRVYLPNAADTHPR